MADISQQYSILRNHISNDGFLPGLWSKLDETLTPRQKSYIEEYQKNTDIGPLPMSCFRGSQMKPYLDIYENIEPQFRDIAARTIGDPKSEVDGLEKLFKTVYGPEKDYKIKIIPRKQKQYPNIVYSEKDADRLRLAIKYLVFDLESTIREVEYLKFVLENQGDASAIYEPKKTPTRPRINTDLRKIVSTLPERLKWLEEIYNTFSSTGPEAPFIGYANLRGPLKDEIDFIDLLILCACDTRYKLESSRRENDYLKKLLEDANR